MKFNRIQFCILISIILLFTSNILSVRTTVDWQETFDTIDSLKDWEVTHGNFTVENGVLIGAVACYNHPTTCLNHLWRNSTAVTGTWSFEIFHPESLSWGSILYYTGIGLDSGGSHPETGYTLIMLRSEIKINYRYSGTNRGTIDSYTLEDGINSWMHFVLTRDETGQIDVYLNSTKILEGTHTGITTSEKINFQIEPYTLLDNITYSSSIDPPVSPESSPSWTLLLSGGSFIAFLFLRKRKKGY
jgi:hypothetical protein